MALLLRTNIHARMHGHAHSFPALYEARLAEIMKEKESWERVLPIFFYNDTVLAAPLSHPLPEHQPACTDRIVWGREMGVMEGWCHVPW